MTSKERKESRYQRRKAKREEKRKQRIGRYDSIESIASLPNLMRAHLDSRRGVMWKASVARFDLYFLKNILMMQRYILKLDRKHICLGAFYFVFFERGKKRDIHSLKYPERVIRRSACVNCFVPVISNSLIYDSGASLKDKGTDFTVRRLKKHLTDYYRKNKGNDGYVLVMDFKSYFQNIVHERLFEIVDRFFRDDSVRALIRMFVQSYGDKKGIYIGPEDSQILALMYASSIDHFIKDQLGFKYYGRYNDDAYIIHNSKEELKKALESIKAECDRLGIVISDKKTQIVKLSRGFKFLKNKVSVTETGKVLLRAIRSSIVRERRKVKKLHKKVVSGEIDFEIAMQSHQCWEAHMAKKNARRSVRNVNNLFNRLYGIKPRKGKNYGRQNTGDTGRNQCTAQSAEGHGLQGDKAL